MAHITRIPGRNIWMNIGTFKGPIYLPVEISLPVPDNVASAGTFVVKLYNINDVDKYDLTSVTLFSKCWISES